MNQAPFRRQMTLWITGASSGIGEALARKLAAEDNFVICTARNVEALTQLAAQFPGKVQPLAADVGCPASLRAAQNQLAEFTDHLDLVILAAGICEYDRGLRLDPASYERVMRTNYLGAVNSLHLALPLLRRSQNAPRIVGISSLSSLVPFPHAQAYGASKAALEYFLQSLQLDLAREKIAVSIVRPGFVATPLTARNDFAMPFIMNADQAATRILAGVERGKNWIDFPASLSLPLRLAALMPPLWRHWVAPRLRRSEAL